MISPWMGVSREEDDDDDSGGGGNDVELEEVDDDDGGSGEVRSQLGGLDCSLPPPIKAQLGGSQLETLANSDLPCDFVASSRHFLEVPVGYALLWLLDSAAFKLPKYTEFGGVVAYRPVEDLAFSVARFIQNNGSFMNYYMYHGGTNFGRTVAGLFIAISYDYDAPIDEYGLLREPKWGHLTNLHKAIKQCEPVLVSSYRSVTWPGTVYGLLENPKLTYSSTVKLRAGINKISLLSVAVGLPTWNTGVLGPVTLKGLNEGTRDLTKQQWSYKSSENLKLQTLDGSSSVEWAEGSLLATKQPLTWYKLMREGVAQYMKTKWRVVAIFNVVLFVVLGATLKFETDLCISRNLHLEPNGYLLFCDYATGDLAQNELFEWRMCSFNSMESYIVNIPVAFDALLGGCTEWKLERWTVLCEN
ncbi:unnamed protein product [Camellia sinensis]